MRADRYSLAAILLHWTIAFALAFQIGMGWQLEHLPRGPVMFAMFQLHKSIGIAILLLSLLRLGLRLATPRPAPMRDDPVKMRLAAAVHSGLYVFMIGAPLTGWLLVSTASIKVPTLLFGLVPWPHIPVEGEVVHAVAEASHSLIAWLGIALFLLHVAGALRHEWLLKEATIQRMLPFALGRASSRFCSALVLLLALATGLGLVLGQQVRTGAMATASAPAPTLARVEAAPPAPPQPDHEATVNATAQDEAAAAVDESEAKAAPVSPTPAPWIVGSGGSLTFRADWNGNAIDGRFHRWSADIHFDPDALAASSIAVNVDLTSADTADSQRDDMLKGTDFFDAGRFATARYQSATISHLGGDRYEARGDLTLKGATRPIPLRFTLKIRDGRAEVSGTAMIDRTAFGVGSGQWASTSEIAAGVAVAFTFTATRK